MSRRVSSLLILATCLVVPSSAVAQTTPQARFGNGSLWSIATSDAATSAPIATGILGDGSHDYRYHGFWIGTGLGLGLAYLGHEFCNDSDTGCRASPGQELLSALMVTGVMGTLGALVGAQFDR